MHPNKKCEAVVADEIRKLAEQSKGATTTIAEIIGSIQSQTKDAIKRMDESAEKVSAGSDVVFAAGKSFKEIQEHVDKVNDSVQGITAATEELSAPSTEVIVTVEKIKSISQETETNSHTISASAQNLKVQSHHFFVRLYFFIIVLLISFNFLTDFPLP